jgi:hypothetical protein
MLSAAEHRFASAQNGVHMPAGFHQS